MPADLPSQTINVGSIIGRAFDTFGREWSLFVVLALPAALGTLLQALLTPGGMGSLGSPGTLGSTGSLAAMPTPAEIASYVGALLASSLLGLVSTIAIAVAADDLWQGRAVGVTDAMARALRVFPRYLLVVLTLTLMVGAIAVIAAAVVVGAYAAAGPAAGVVIGVLGFLVALPVALFVSARLSLIVPVVVLERNGIFASIVRAWDLSRGHAILLFALSFVISLCAAIPLWGGSLFAAFVTGPVIAGIALAIATLVFAPLPAIAMVLAWGDRVGGRYRDSEVMARGRGRRVAALLVFGLGGILFVAGFGVAAQASAGASLR